MRVSKVFRLCAIPAFLTATLAGCSGGGTTQDNGPPAGEPLTKESLKASADAINAQGKGMGPTGKK